MSIGVLSDAVMGLLFHKEGWLGGYGSVSRRMVRLGYFNTSDLLLLRCSGNQSRSVRYSRRGDLCPFS
jgi:hypothetical protein